MKITHEELTRLLAEKVMGWECSCNAREQIIVRNKNGISWNTFNPLEDANQALQVLEAYSDIYSYNLGRDQLGHYCWLYDMKSVRHAKSLNHAICLAIAEAVTGNKYELKN